MIFYNVRKFLSILFNINCLHCGSLVPLATSHCKLCQDNLDHFYKEEPNLKTISFQNQLDDEHYNFSYKKLSYSYRYLYVWPDAGADMVSNWIYFLKSSLSAQAWLGIANVFIEHLFFLLKIQSSMHTQICDKKIVFIPVPSSTNRNHSVYLARGLAQQLPQGSYSELLMKDHVFPEEISSAQKFKNRRDRLQKAFKINEQFTHHLNKKDMVVIVDDVMTSGASFLAAYNALYPLIDEGVKIECWAAFYRPRPQE
ncbi:MAG: ComF family protein [Pseudobdellovibrio sp.]